MYTKEVTDASYRALKEIVITFNQNRDLRNRFALAGGWAPYFITLGKFDHGGSKDIDLVLSPDIMKSYTQIQGLLVSNLKYEQTKPFEFRRKDSNLEFEIHFLFEPESIKELPPNISIYKIQNGLAGFIVNGCSIVFEDNFIQDIGGEQLIVSGPSAMISLKGHSYHSHRYRHKDPYDIYAIMSYTKNITEVLQERTIKNLFVRESIELIRDVFKSETDDGPRSAAEYMVDDPSKRAETAARIYHAVRYVLDKIVFDNVEQ